MYSKPAQPEASHDRFWVRLVFFSPTGNHCHRTKILQQLSRANTVYPKNVSIVVSAAITVFSGEFRFADSTKSGERDRVVVDSITPVKKLGTQLTKVIFTTGEVTIAALRKE